MASFTQDNSSSFDTPQKIETKPAEDFSLLFALNMWILVLYRYHW